MREPRRMAPLVVDETMRGLYALLDVIAPSAMSLLVLGETGTGKDVYARALHARSPRAHRPFIALNAASLVESLLESELFGHARGAYTGAIAAKPGLLELADGGTIFLDEIGELSPGIQAKLLRVLEHGEILRVGSVQPRYLDVRVVAATNVDLDAAIAAGRFRRDLYYRLNGFVVTLPPLRDRRADILPLAHHFAGATPLSAAAAQALLAHAWPGNVRELRTVVERALVLSAARAIEPAHLMLAPAARPTAAPSRLATVAPSERAQILDALAHSRGNQKQAARLLGISRQTLAKRLDAHRIGRPHKGA